MVFPNQELTGDQQLRFSENFGIIMEHPSTAGTKAPSEGIRAQHRELLPVTSETNNNAWHTDITGMEKPPSLAILYGKQPLLIEGVDEDTLFTNKYRAYDQLSPGLKDFLHNRWAIHSMKQYKRGKANLVSAKNLGTGTDGQANKAREEFDAFEADVYKIPDEQLHPCIRQHPETGKFSVFCDTASTKCFEGWTRKESMPILEKIVEIGLENNVYRHKWAKGDVVCWDNRCTAHKGPDNAQFPKGAHRFMIRVTVIPEGELRPCGPGMVPGRPVLPEESAALSGLPPRGAGGYSSL